MVFYFSPEVRLSTEDPGMCGNQHVMAPGELSSHFVRCGKECSAKEGPAGGHWVWRCQQCADEGLNPWIYPWGHVVNSS